MTETTTTVETRFGRFDANTANTVSMIEPLPGFEMCRRYLIITVPDLEPLVCLQGLDEPRPSFLAIDPRQALPRYDVGLGEVDRRRLSVAGEEPLLWLALVHVTPDGTATANFRAPIVVNPSRMMALQLVGSDNAYALDAPLE